MSTSYISIHDIPQHRVNDMMCVVWGGQNPRIAGPKFLRFLIESGVCKSVRSLSMAACTWNDTEVLGKEESLLGVIAEHLTGLEQLHLGWVSSGTWDSEWGMGAAGNKSMPHLHTLNVTGCKVEREDGLVVLTRSLGGSPLSLQSVAGDAGVEGVDYGPL